MRWATCLIHTSEIKILLNLPITLVLTFVNVKTLIMLMLFLEQARGRPTWSLRLPSAHGHHVGDPWVTRYAKLAKYVKLSVYKHDRAQSDTTHSGSVYSAS